jgi:hypothetical protein
MGLFSNKKAKKGALLELGVQGETSTSNAKKTTNNGTENGSDSSSDSSYEKFADGDGGADATTTPAVISSSTSSMNSSKLENEIHGIYESMQQNTGETEGNAESTTYDDDLDHNGTEQTDDQTEMTEDDDDEETQASKGKEEETGVVSTVKGAVTNAIDSTKAAGLFVQTQAQKLRTRAQQGPLPFSILAFLGGIAMVVTNFFDLLFEIFYLSPMAALMSTYCVIFGLVIIKMEGRRWELDTSQLPALYRNVNALKYVWGRGCFYIFAGTIQISKMQIDDLIVGAYICFVGIASVMVGRGTASKLAILSSALEDKQVVCEKFMAYDKDEDGFLTYFEFEKMIKDLGLELDHNELDVALFTVDQDQDDKISYEECIAWWEGFHDASGADQERPWSLV